MSKSLILPVIMSGGAGSRLWPLSRIAMPKQLLPLVTDKTMVQETALRLSGSDFADPVFICNQTHAAPITQQMHEMKRDIGAIITEPAGRNTAPVAVIAALHAQSLGEDHLVLLAPADHHVTNPEAFREAVTAAIPAAMSGKLVTFGITPNYPETGYGYIQQGNSIGNDVYDVKAFREKPDAATAQAYVDSGEYAWNAGIFLYKPSGLLAEIETFEPDILRYASEALRLARREGLLVHLDKETFSNCPSQSIDYAIMEKTSHAAIVPCDIGWNDIGSFSALHELCKDGNDMATVEGVISVNSQNCLVKTNGPRVSLVGVEGLAVIVQDDEVLVCSLEAAQKVKTVVETLKGANKIYRL
ncbi:MAG: mannose-1-phosphate guanylyltransferase/mannose-6-phosphate isomerase [Maricaulaceae bacterium]